jgi:predicted alpha/beta-fold hydrolase
LEGPLENEDRRGKPPSALTQTHSGQALAAHHDPDAQDKLMFRPLPLLCNPHVQTVLGAYLPDYFGPSPDRDHLVRLPDGDALVLHDNQPRSWKQGDPLTLLIHGLTGSHASGQMRRMARLLIRRGVRTVRIDLRGTGKGFPFARQVYHGGRSDDIRAALLAMHAWSPTSPLLVLGVSLGGNLALKMAGEDHLHDIPNLTRVAALAPPIDLEGCASMLARPHNRIYEKNFVRLLVAEAQRRDAQFAEPAPVRFPPCMTMRLFDDLYTAPRCGFQDALDYYRRASAEVLVPHIRVPTLILTARDDPFIAVEAFERLRVPGHIRVHIVPNGGHVGFLGWDGAWGIRWAERRLVEWALGK